MCWLKRGWSEQAATGNLAALYLKPKRDEGVQQCNAGKNLLPPVNAVGEIEQSIHPIASANLYCIPFRI